jgi:hypothetical protein
MTQTNATPKVSYVTPVASEDPSAPATAKAQSLDDSYGTSDADVSKYKGLVAGSHAKAEPIDGGVLSEMANAESNEPQRAQTHFERIQQVLAGLIPARGDIQSLQDKLTAIPYVPDLDKDFSELPEHMEPIVQRYAALEKVLMAMSRQIKVARKPKHSYALSPAEVRSLNRYQKRLNAAIADCQRERAKAMDALNDQIKQQKQEEMLNNIVENLEDRPRPELPPFERL